MSTEKIRNYCVQHCKWTSTARESMATNKLNRNLSDYIGTKEEAIVKRVLEWIVTEMDFPPPGFYNMVIRTSNAGRGTSFKDASICLRFIDDFRDAVRENYESGFPKCAMVLMKDILNMSVLKEFVADGVKAVEKFPGSFLIAFLALLDFLREKRKHEESVKKVMTSMPDPTTDESKETNVMVVLAHHLFSQLIPGQIHEVDKYANLIPTECGCGCQARVCEGDTSIGSHGTWHGRVDILLNGTIAVTVKEETDSRDDESDYDIDEYGPEGKRCKFDCATRKNDSVLLDEKVVCQIFAEAITNGFAQVNMNRDTLSHFLIPTFGASSEHVCITLYDSENDYLLHIKDVLGLWYPDEEGVVGQLNDTTIIIIWLFLNFTLFTGKNLCALTDLEKSGLHEKLKDHLAYYRKIKTREMDISETNFACMWKSLKPTVKRPR